MAASRTFLPALATALVIALLAALLPGGDARGATGGELGDVDCDGAVTSLDSAFVLQANAALIPSVPCEKVDDVDEDGLVTALDASFILQYVAALIPILPPPAIALANIPTHCPTQAQLTDGAIIATDILTRTTHDLVLPRGQRIDMGIELDGVLAAIREAEPAVAEIRPHTDLGLGSIAVWPAGGLNAHLRDLLAGAPETVNFATGYDGFDRLNTYLRLQGFRAFFVDSPELLTLFLCFPYHVNVRAVAGAYDALEELRGADPEYKGKGSGDIEAFKDGATWNVMFWQGSGDCPSGCRYNDYYFFAVSGDVVAAIDEAEALQDDRFLQLICYVHGLPGCPLIEAGR